MLCGPGQHSASSRTVDRMPPDDRHRRYQGRIADVPDSRPSQFALEIRPVRTDEHEAAGALVEAAYLAGGLLDNDRGYGAHVRDVAGRASAHHVLVALRDSRLVGTVTLTPYGTPHSELAHEDEVEFRYLGVAPEAWGGGVAQALVAACEDYAVATDAVRLVICVISDNTRAHRLYERLGFVRAPDRDWTPVPGVDLWAFTRPVPRPTPVDV
jgi:ribosomal protein S18 acetylase RimI-like enzyme